MIDEKLHISVLGVASDLGANIAGSRIGPEAIRLSGLIKKLISLGYKTKDIGNIIPSLSSTTRSPQKVDDIAETLKSVKQKTHQSLQNNSIPLTIGGDHSLSIGTIAASNHHFKNLGVIWIDTHADINTPQSSVTNNIHGMPISTLMGTGYPEFTKLIDAKIKPEQMVLIGLRDLDSAEKQYLKITGIQYFSMRQVDELGIQGIFKNLKTTFFNRINHLHVSFDLDVMDPIILPGVSTPVPGGFTLREAHLLLELLYETQLVRSVDFVELNPMNDINGKSAALAVQLIGSLFGSSIV